MGAWLRTWLVTPPLVILLTAYYGTLSLIATLLDATGNLSHRMAQKWARALLRAGGVRVHVAGLDKIRPNGSYVFASNHLSLVDTPVMLASIPCQFRFLAKRSLARVPFIGHHLRRGGHILVAREDARAAARALKEAGSILRARGISLLLFPEGSRSANQLAEFKEGAALVAIAAQAPIVPVAILGTAEVMPVGARHMAPGDVRLYIGDPIPTEGLTQQDRRALTEKVRAEVAALLAAASRHGA